MRKQTSHRKICTVIGGRLGSAYERSVSAFLKKIIQISFFKKSEILNFELTQIMKISPLPHLFVALGIYSHSDIGHLIYQKKR